MEKIAKLHQETDTEVTVDIRLSYKVRAGEGEDTVQKSIDQILPELLAFFNTVEIKRLTSRPIAHQ